MPYTKKVGKHNAKPTVTNSVKSFFKGYKPHKTLTVAGAAFLTLTLALSGSALLVDKQNKDTADASAYRVTLPAKLDTWDVDLNGKTDQRDGTLIIGYMFGGTTFSDRVKIDTDTSSQRKTVAEIGAYIKSLDNAKLLDVDGDGKNSALGDGMMLTRYFIGMTGSNITDKAISSTATRKTPEQIIDFINKAQLVDSAKLSAWDVDLNGKVDQRDGTLIAGYMFSGNTLADRVKIDVSTNSKRKTPVEIGNYIKSLDTAKSLDVDGDGKNSALGDGIMLTRYFNGLTGNDLIQGAISPTATRKTPEQIIDFINKASVVSIDGVIIGDSSSSSTSSSGTSTSYSSTSSGTTNSNSSSFSKDNSSPISYTSGQLTGSIGGQVSGGINLSTYSGPATYLNGDDCYITGIITNLIFTPTIGLASNSKCPTGPNSNGTILFNGITIKNVPSNFTSVGSSTSTSSYNR